MVFAVEATTIANNRCATIWTLLLIYSFSESLSNWKLLKMIPSTAQKTQESLPEYYKI